ncbi:LysM peptidoglycan-binding domain-containing protein [Paenibacillus sp. GSMTC-2017]|uniref:LysM peptidoglycan-binding domain-containing protein n=1 Tax=Paenibacillus sp. GSMTC-2017 TaxID=2794350 RepID=UPI0018D7EBAA|nr:LysM peptidoglycan-binding domain-containing protein [Paenibacillus sp. GSMTC-2017]
MSNQTNGLRFDVYERVHLPDDVAAIDELEEIELVPRIQVIDQGDQAILRGQLLLSGVYRGQDVNGGQLTLEHWIPVEISLPMNRVTRLDDISIEIDNFDVDLLSARTLNITGVLSLRGITVDPVEDHNSQQWEDESFTAVHERDHNEQNAFILASEQQDATLYGAVHHHYNGEGVEGRQAEFQGQEHDQLYITGQQLSEPHYEEQRDIQLTSQQETNESWLNLNANEQSVAQHDQNSTEYELQQFANRASEQAQSQTHTQAYTQAHTQLSDQSIVWEPVYRQEQVQAIDHTLQEEQYSQEEHDLQAEQDLRDEQSVQAEQALQLEQDFQAEQAYHAEQEQAYRKQQEVQIAFSGKPSGSSEEGQSNLGFRTLLQSSKREQAAREAVEQVQQAEEAAKANAVEEEIEWKRLFLSKQSEDNAFRKIKMCIVQREETLEQIALRYSLNPRELLIRNGLHESAVAEGQLLYIP